jgi:protein gp37
MGNPRYAEGFSLALHWDKVKEPLRWNEPRKVFVNSMSDLLHDGIPDSFVVEVFGTMRSAHWHTFQVLTKRADRWPVIERVIGSIPGNIIPGVSIEDKKHLRRLRGLGAVESDVVRMVSFEPLLEDLGSADELAAQLVDAKVGWVITGGESGWNARPAELDWFRVVRDACATAGIAFFHKQHGGRGTSHAAKRAGRFAVLDGVVHQAYPVKPKKVAPRVQASLF